MSTIDATRGVLVVRIVYDGPALSGKTTSLRSLASGVSSTVVCPEERAGRTLFFDWMDYVGGLFEGRQIRCQIVGVPGQRQLRRRRKLLLEGADAVVCVLDTRRSELEFGLHWLRGVAAHCRRQAPPVGLVVQANKRDAASSVPTDELRTRLRELGPMATVESIATTSDGIREGFVLAVRLALDRVRALAADGQLGIGAPNEDAPDELLRKLYHAETAENDVTEVETDRIDSVREIAPLLAAASNGHGRLPSFSPPDAGADATLAAEREFVPDPMMPGGMIWPPVDGRTLLHEVAELGIRPARGSRGDWSGSGAGWRFHSGQEAVYADLNRARSELIAWARLHAANATQLSSGRAVILADAGNGRLRLWQLVRVEAALRERLVPVLSAAAPHAVAEGLVEVANQLSAARDWFAEATTGLPCTLWTVGAAESYRPLFVGMMPDLGATPTDEPRSQALLFRELAPHLRELRRSRVDYAEVTARLHALADSSAESAPARWLAEVADGVD